MDKLNLDGYKRRLLSYNKNTNTGKIDSMKARILRDFHKSPSCFEVLINDVIRDVHITAGYKGENWILTKPNEFISVGDLVLWEGNNYLCSSLENNITVQHKGSLSRCNGDLKWQQEEKDVVAGKKAYVLHETPCLLVDKTSVYSDGLSKTIQMWLGTDQISITVRTTDATNKIPLNKRFIFRSDKNNIYEVSRIDNMLEYGLTTFVCKKSLYSPYTDNLELNLANYNGKVDADTDMPAEPTEPEIPSTSDGLSITGDTRITVWDKNIKYTVNTESAVKWTLSNDSVLKIVSTQTNECTLSPVSTSKIGDTVLKVELVDNPSVYAEINIGLYYS